MFFKIAQKVDYYLGYFCKRICRQVLLKIAQSGYTGWYPPFGFASNQRTKETLFRSRNGIRSAHYSLIAAKTLLNLNLYFELQLCFKIGFVAACGQSLKNLRS